MPHGSKQSSPDLLLSGHILKLFPGHVQYVTHPGCCRCAWTAASYFNTFARKTSKGRHSWHAQMTVDDLFQCEGAVVWSSWPPCVVNSFHIYICIYDLILLASQSATVVPPHASVRCTSSWTVGDGVVLGMLQKLLLGMSSDFFQCDRAVSLFRSLCWNVNCLPVSREAH